MNSIPWQPAPVFKLAVFFNARGTDVRENDLVVYLQERVQKQRAVSVSQTRSRPLKKRELVLTPHQAVRARKITLIPFINIHICLSQIRLMLFRGWYFLLALLLLPVQPL